MIIGTKASLEEAKDFGGRATLDALFRKTVAARPEALALVDPSDRADFTTGAPRRLTYAELDREVSALAALFIGYGLPRDSVVAVQLGNTVESIVALLAVVRAGLIATPIPLAWRRREFDMAVARTGARAILTAARIGPVEHADLGRHVAAEAFGVRFVFAFGEGVPDGVVRLDEALAEFSDPPESALRPDNPADHVAVITWDARPEGFVPVARSHNDLVAAAFGPFLEGRMDREDVIVTTLLGASLAGLATSVVPWLLGGCTLALLQPFEQARVAETLETLNGTRLVVPAPVLKPLGEAGTFGLGALRGIAAVWRSPATLGTTAPWTDVVPLLDVSAFGDYGLIAVPRLLDGTPGELPLGPVATPRGAVGAPTVATTRIGAGGTLEIAGAMAPKADFAGAVTPGATRLAVGTDGFVDTGFPAAMAEDKESFTVTGERAGVVQIGGLAFPGGHVEAATRPDALFGTRVLDATTFDDDGWTTSPALKTRDGAARRVPRADVA